MVNALISAVEMEDYDTECIPAVVTLTFTTGQKVTYQLKNDQHYNLAVQKNKSMDYIKPTIELVEQKTTDNTFEALFNQCARQLSVLNDQHKEAFEMAERLCAKEKEDVNDYCKRHLKEIEEV